MTEAELRAAEERISSLLERVENLLGAGRNTTEFDKKIDAVLRERAIKHIQGGKTALVVLSDGNRSTTLWLAGERGMVHSPAEIVFAALKDLMRR